MIPSNYLSVWSLLKKEVFRFFKVGIQTIIGPAVSSLLFLAVFSLALGRSVETMNNVPFVNFIAPGLIMMTILQNAFANSASSIGQAKSQGNIVDVLMAPLNDFELTIGYVGGSLARGLICGLITSIGFLFFISFEVYSFSALMALLTIFTLINRISKGPGALQDSLIITTLTTPVVFPSLIMVVLLITSFGSLPSQYFGAAADLYLVGIASMVIVLPILGIIIQWSGMIKSRGAPFSHIIYTMIIFSLLNFVAFSSFIGEGINQQLIGHGTNIILNAIFIIQIINGNKFAFS